MLFDIGSFGSYTTTTSLEDMEHPQGHDQNADQIAYWNGAGGQRWADRQPVQDILLSAGRRHPDRSRQDQGRRADDRCRLRQRRHHASRLRERWRHRAMSRHRYSAPMLARAREVAPRALPVEFVLADATVYPFTPAEFRSAGLAVRRDVLRRSRAVVCQHAQGAAPIGPAGICLLARAARKSVLHDAAAGGLPARSENAAAGAGRSRPVRVCLGSARPSHPQRGRVFRRSRWSRAILRSTSRSGAASMPRCKGALEIGPAAARWRTIRRTSSPPRRNRSAKR